MRTRASVCVCAHVRVCYPHTQINARRKKNNNKKPQNNPQSNNTGQTQNTLKVSKQQKAGTPAESRVSVVSHRFHYCVMKQQQQLQQRQRSMQAYLR